MTAKVKFDVKAGLFEIEGTEEFVSGKLDVLQKFLDTYANTGTNNEHSVAIVNREESGSNLGLTFEGKAPLKKRASNPTKSRKYEIDMSLNLYPTDKESLRVFVSKYALKSAFDYNLAFVYYLERVLKIPQITMNHLYTCYKDLDVKSPENLYQSIVDTKNRKQWLNSSDTDNIVTTNKGIHYLEYDMPKVQAGN